MAENKKKTADEQPVLSMEEMQAQMQAMMEQAKAEADKLLYEAKKSADAILAAAGAKQAAEEEAEAKKAEEAKAHEAWLNEKVKVKLFKDNGKYKDDVFVAVNGENRVIKRGVEVEIERKFAMVLDQSDRQDYETSMLIEEKSSEFARETEARGM